MAQLRTRIDRRWTALVLASLAVSACGRDASQPSPPPALFTRLNTDESRKLSATLSGQSSMQAISAELKQRLESSIDSMTSADREFLVSRMMTRTPDEVRNFLGRPDERFLLNSALLPGTGEARVVTLNVTGFSPSTLWVRRLGPPNQSTSLYEGHSRDSSVLVRFFHDSVVVGEISSRTARLTFRSGAFGDVAFAPDTTTYVPEAAPIVPRRARPLRPQILPRGVERPREDAAAPPPADCAPRDVQLVVGVPSVLVAMSDRPALEKEIGLAVRGATDVLSEGQISNEVHATVRFLNGSITGSSLAVLHDIEDRSSAASRELRDAVTASRANAGILVLGEVDDRACGRSFVMERGEPSLPFGYVLRRCLGKKSLAHEMTHLLGATHTPTEVPAFSSESHGFRNADADFRTIEATCPEGTACSDRISMLSDKTRPFGTMRRGADNANSARAFRASICQLTGPQ
jgi:hypothetical protein